MVTKTTLQLVPGDRLLIYGGRLAVTVHEVVPAGYVGTRGHDIFNVMYEPHGHQWSAGNSGIASSEWTVMMPCVYCRSDIRASNDPNVPYVHKDTDNSYCDVTTPASAVALVGTTDRTEAIPDHLPL